MATGPVQTSGSVQWGGEGGVRDVTGPGSGHHRDTFTVTRDKILQFRDRSRDHLVTLVVTRKKRVMSSMCYIVLLLLPGSPI